VPTFEIYCEDVESKAIIDILTECKLCPSKSESRRMIEGGGITLNDEKVTDIKYVIQKSDFENGYALLRKGKKNYMKVIIK
jgi:tyrosyl-tRNA synthetase